MGTRSGGGGDKNRRLPTLVKKIFFPYVGIFHHVGFFLFMVAFLLYRGNLFHHMGGGGFSPHGGPYWGGGALSP